MKSRASDKGGARGRSRGEVLGGVGKCGGGLQCVCE